MLPVKKGNEADNSQRHALRHAREKTISENNFRNTLQQFFTLD